MNNISKSLLRISNFPLWTVLFVIAILLIYFLIAENSRVRPEEGPVKIYFASDISYAHQQVIDQFNKKYKGKIEVVPIDLSFKKFSTNERKELLARTLRSSSDRIDVFAVDQIWVSRFAKWSEPLDKYFPKTETDKILNYALASCYYENKLVAIPINIDIGMMYYRRDLMQKVPGYDTLKDKLKNSITWDEFLKISRRFKKSKNPFYIFTADDYEGLVCCFVELLLSENRNYFNENGFNLNTPEARKALNLLVGFVNNYHISPKAVTDFNENSSYKYFIENDGVFLRGWPSYEKDYKNLFKGTSKDQLLEKAALPHFQGFPPTAIFGGWNLMVSKYSKKKKEVLAFLKYFISEEAQEIFYTVGAYLPILTKFYNDSLYIKKYPDLIFKKELLKTGVHRPFLEDYTRISDIISYYAKKAIKEEISVDSALKDATSMINSNKILIK